MQKYCNAYNEQTRKKLKYMNKKYNNEVITFVIMSMINFYLPKKEQVKQNNLVCRNMPTSIKVMKYNNK